MESYVDATGITCTVVKKAAPKGGREGQSVVQEGNGMSYGPHDAEAVVASDVVSGIVQHGDAEVTVNVAGTLVDVCGVTYDHDREKFVFELHPDDLDEVLRKPLRCLRPPASTPCRTPGCDA